MGHNGLKRHEPTRWMDVRGFLSLFGELDFLRQKTRETIAMEVKQDAAEGAEN